jgi:hypothetical protein
MLSWLQQVNAITPLAQMSKRRPPGLRFTAVGKIDGCRSFDAVVSSTLSPKKCNISKSLGTRQGGKSWTLNYMRAIYENKLNLSFFALWRNL